MFTKVFHVCFSTKSLQLCVFPLHSTPQSELATFQVLGGRLKCECNYPLSALFEVLLPSDVLRHTESVFFSSPDHSFLVFFPFWRVDPLPMPQLSDDPTLGVLIWFPQALSGAVHWQLSGSPISVCPLPRCRQMPVRHYCLCYISILLSNVLLQWVTSKNENWLLSKSCQRLSAYFSWINT